MQAKDFPEIMHTLLCLLPLNSFSFFLNVNGQLHLTCFVEIHPLFPFHYHTNKTSYNSLEQNIAGQISNKTFKISHGECLYDDERYLLQPNEANYIHLNAGSRVRSPCIPPVNACHMVARSPCIPPVNACHMVARSPCIPPVNACHMVARSKACGTIAMGSGALSSEQI